MRGSPFGSLLSRNDAGVDEGCGKRFQTKLQVLHRLQEGISYGDGVEYTTAEYLRTAGRRTQEWKAKYYPDHDLLSRHAEALGKQADSRQEGKSNDNLQQKLFIPENLERDFWEIVETHTRQVTVEYGNDVDTATYGSAFPISERGRSVRRPSLGLDSSSTSSEEEREPEFGTPECTCSVGFFSALMAFTLTFSFSKFSRLS